MRLTVGQTECRTVCGLALDRYERQPMRLTDVERVYNVSR